MGERTHGHGRHASRLCEGRTRCLGHEHAAGCATSFSFMGMDATAPATTMRAATVPPLRKKRRKEGWNEWNERERDQETSSIECLLEKCREFEFVLLLLCGATCLFTCVPSLAFLLPSRTPRVVPGHTTSAWSRCLCKRCTCLAASLCVGMYERGGVRGERERARAPNLTHIHTHTYAFTYRAKSVMLRRVVSAIATSASCV